MEQPHVAEIPDRNKTPLTHAATTTAAEWLDCHGFKPVETEVPVANGVADLASAIEATQTELIALKLIKRPPQVRMYTAGGRFHYEEPEGYRENYRRWTERLEELQQLHTAVVEVKTDRADFLRDKKFTRQAAAQLCFLAVTPGVVRAEEFPKGWGILLLSSEGRRVKRYAVAPVVFPQEMTQSMDLLYAVALRRDHHTRYARFRAAQKRERLRRIEERETIARVLEQNRTMAAKV